MSEPRAAGQRRAATAAPEPPLEPPGTRSRSQGLRVGGVTMPQANSCMRSLPRITAPAARSRATAWLSAAGKVRASTAVPARVGMSAVV